MDGSPRPGVVVEGTDRQGEDTERRHQVEGDRLGMVEHRPRKVSRRIRMQVRHRP